MTPASDPAEADAARLPADLLTRGEITVEGRLRDASNATLYCTIALDGVTRNCVWKPVAGERPLWDFPDGTLAGRELAAHLVSEATGWGIVPPTVLREGPYGTGMCQLWIDTDADETAQVVALQPGPKPEAGWLGIAEAETEDEHGNPARVLLVHADSTELRRVAVFDAVVNNSDRKGGHLLPVGGGRVFGIDHGICFHTDDKLRTLLWGWAGEPLTAEAREVLERLDAELGDAGPLRESLGPHLTVAEIDATRGRVVRMLEQGLHPVPSGRWPAIPWPPI